MKKPAQNIKLTQNTKPKQKKIVFTLEYEICITENMTVDISNILDNMSDNGLGKVLDARIEEAI